VIPTGRLSRSCVLAAFVPQQRIGDALWIRNARGAAHVSRSLPSFVPLALNLGEDFVEKPCK
jgi:hypothetical protein